MSATGNSGTEPVSDSAEDQRYFLAIEEVFIRLRGAPLLLSPADWRTARDWRRQGIPLELVQGTLEELFERRRERESSDSISSLRYCKRAVEKAWREARELSAMAERAPARALEAGPRLAALARELPRDLPGREQVGERILAIGEACGGDPERAESALARLEEELLATLEPRLAAPQREALAAAEASALAALARRLPEEQVEDARRLLHRQLLREELGLPVLSLFSVGGEE